VGKITKLRLKSFAEIVGDFANAPYNENGWGQEGVIGYSCLGLCYAYAIKRGYELPEEIKNLSFEGLKIDNFHEYAAHHKGAALIKLFKLFQSFGRDIPVHQKIAGDIVLVKRTNDTYPAIYVGNGQIMAAYLYCGVKVIKCDDDNKVIVVRRF
jgi:hypothetical protein